MDYVAYIDESGHKPKAATPPLDSKDFGLAVSLIIPEDRKESFLEDIRKELPASLYDNSHITDMKPEDQKACRESIYQAIRNHDVVILYDAISISGYHYMKHVLPTELRKKAKAAARNPIKIADPHDNPSAHAEMLAGVILKSRAYVSDNEIENGRNPLGANINIFTDRVDESIIKEVEKHIKELDGITEPQEHIVPGYDPDKKQVVKGKITIETSGIEDVVHILYTTLIEGKNNFGILAADTVANALYKHLRDKVAQAKEKLPKLNQPETIEGFELFEHIRGFIENDASDVLYGFKENKG